jgi:hypothetical protein
MTTEQWKGGSIARTHLIFTAIILVLVCMCPACGFRGKAGAIPELIRSAFRN